MLNWVLGQGRVASDWEMGEEGDGSACEIEIFAWFLIRMRRPEGCEGGGINLDVGEEMMVGIGWWV